MPSFDIVSNTDMQEIDNATNSFKRELETRYDFKGTKCSVERKDAEITLNAEDDFKLKQMQEMMKVHVTRRKLDARVLDFKEPEKAAGASLRQKVVVKQGIEQDVAKRIVKEIKDRKMKVQASIQGEEVRVTGKKRDDLQEAMALVRGLPIELPLQFVNFRD